jgi:uncharacterized protein YybS (DUF2232 family)
MSPATNTAKWTSAAAAATRRADGRAVEDSLAVITAVISTATAINPTIPVVHAR